jgi:hypothetical protein
MEEKRQYPFYTAETKELFKALCDAKKKFKKARLDKRGNFGPYASYESLEEATVDALCEYGLFVKQSPGKEDGDDVFYTTITHSSGQYSIDRMALRTSGPDMQKFGGAISYAQRYAYGSILGISIGEDDDGEANAQSFQKGDDMKARQFNKDLGTGAPSEAQLKLIGSLIRDNIEAAKKAFEDLGITDIASLNKTTASQLISLLKGDNK